MTIRFQSIHFDADQKLLDFIRQKLNKLDKFNDSILDAEVILKLDKSSDDRNKIVEVKINVPRKPPFVSQKQEHTFEEATDKILDVLAAQLKKHKDKQHHRPIKLEDNIEE